MPKKPFSFQAVNCVLTCLKNLAAPLAGCGLQTLRTHYRIVSLILGNMPPQPPVHSVVLTSGQPEPVPFAANIWISASGRRLLAVIAQRPQGVSDTACVFGFLSGDQELSTAPCAGMCFALISAQRAFIVIFALALRAFDKVMTETAFRVLNLRPCPFWF